MKMSVFGYLKPNKLKFLTWST